MIIAIPEWISHETCHVISNGGMPFIYNSQQRACSLKLIDLGAVFNFALILKFQTAALQTLLTVQSKPKSKKRKNASKNFEVNNKNYSIKLIVMETKSKNTPKKETVAVKT